MSNVPRMSLWLKTLLAEIDRKNAESSAAEDERKRRSKQEKKSTGNKEPPLESQ